MIRKQIYITEQEDNYIKSASKKLGISVTDYFRRMIDHEMNAITMSTEIEITNNGTEITKELADKVYTEIVKRINKGGITL